MINGAVTHNPNTATNAPWTPSARVYFICTNLMVASNGTINVDAKGYGYNATTVTGYGPGGGLNYAGGGYGGVGGQPQGTAGQPYGSTNAPTDPGSGARANGGGAVLIQASGVVTVNNTISANGGGNTSAGSGGSVYITCATFAGSNGVVSANGGVPSTDTSGGGGGGRIAVIYDTGAQSLLPVPAVRFSTAYAYHPSGLSYMGDMGTLYFPDGSLLDRSVVLHNGELNVPGLTNWSATAVTFSNCQFRIAQDRFVLAIANDLSVVGTNASMCKVHFPSNATVTCGGNVLVSNARLNLTGGSAAALTCPGNVTVTNNAILAVYGVTNASLSYGAQVTVGGALRISTNAWVYPYSHPTNGASPFFQLGSLAIDAGGGIDAKGKGWATGCGPGSGAGHIGGSYGGKGGGSSPNPYGSSNAPALPGSGSGTSGKAPGGGLVWVQSTGTLLVNGTITADGSGTQEGYADGSSGGGIYLKCIRFSGTGTLTAKGGNGDTQPSTCGGGGGRIAVWSALNLSTLTATNVAGGTHLSYPGTAGTIVFGQSVMPGSIFTFR